MSETKLEPKKEVTSTANHIQLLKWTPEAFGGIDPSRNFIFYLNEAPIIGFEGDQGVGKTSLMSCLIAHLGGDEAANSAHVTNDAEGKRVESRKSTLTFKDKRRENVTYEVRMTKASIQVKKLEDADGTILTSSVDKPKTFLADMFGPIGISPMVLKEKDGKKQIEWVRGLYKFTPEQLKQELILKTQYSQKFTERTGVNADVVRLKKEVLTTTYYTFDTENSCFVPAPIRETDEKFVKENNFNEADLNKKFEDANARQKQLTEANLRLTQRLESKKKIEKDIKEIEEILAAKRLEFTDNDEKIRLAGEYIKQYEKAPEELEAVRLLMQNAGDVKLKKQNLEASAAKVQEYQDKEQKQITLNGDLDELKIKRKNFIKQFTPDVPGLELIIHDGIDNPLPEGMYLNGRTPQELSESELWDFFMQICRAIGIHFMFIENLNSLGSAAIERINWFVTEGYGQVFYTAMNRGQKEMKLTMHTEIPV